MVYVTLILAVLTVSAEPTTGDLVGTVADAAGKPITAATVFIYTAKPRVGPGILCPSCYGDCGKKAVSDGTGKFKISRLNPGLLFKVLVVAEGFRPQFAENVDPWEGPLDVRLEKMPADLSSRAVLRGAQRRIWDVGAHWRFFATRRIICRIHPTGPKSHLPDAAG